MKVNFEIPKQACLVVRDDYKIYQYSVELCVSSVALCVTIHSRITQSSTEKHGEPQRKDFVFPQSLKIKIAPSRINNTAIVFFSKLVSLKIFPPITVAHKTEVLLTASVNATEARLIETICVYR